MPDLDWHPDARPVPDELTPGYNHAIYVAPEPVYFPPLLERIEAVMRGSINQMYGVM